MIYALTSWLGTQSPYMQPKYCKETHLCGAKNFPEDFTLSTQCQQAVTKMHMHSPFLASQLLSGVFELTMNVKDIGKKDSSHSPKSLVLRKKADKKVELTYHYTQILFACYWLPVILKRYRETHCLFNAPCDKQEVGKGH